MIEILFLRVLHVVGGILWVGISVFATFLLAPALAELGPAGGSVVAKLRERGFFVFMPSVALITLASGARLLWLGAGGNWSAYVGTPRGATYCAAGAAALLAFVIGMLVTRPNAARVGELSVALASATDERRRASLGSELDAARRRGARVTFAITLLLLGSALGMSVARYLG